MKLTPYMATLLLAIAAILPSVSLAHVADRHLVEHAEKATIALRAGSSTGAIFCTAVAVGKQMIQTNAHCLQAAKDRGHTVWMDNQGTASWCLFDSVVANDGRDNVLIDTPCRTWTHYVSRTENVVPYMQVFQWGHPMGKFRALRTGVLSTRYIPLDAPQLPKAEALMFDLNGFGGDSGGGIFNEEGKLICTTSFIYNPTFSPFRLMGCYPHRFTKEQLGG